MKRQLLTDADVAEYMKPELEWLRSQTVYTPAAGDKEPQVTASTSDKRDDSQKPSGRLETSEHDLTLNQDYREFIEELLKNPSEQIGVHYTNLRWSAGKGDRVRKQLKILGMITMRRDRSTGGRPREIYTLSKLGLKTFHQS